MIAACAEFARPEPWGIGMYRAATGEVEYRISQADHERDIAWVVEQLSRLGFEAGGTVLSVAALWERPWIDPVWQAIRRLGGCIAYADIWSFDAHRTALFARRLDIDLVFGLSGEVAETLAGSGDLTGLFERIPNLIVRPEAVDLLTAAGLRPGLYLQLGPAVAIECRQRQGAHLNRREWAVTSDDTGQLLVTTVGPRLHVVIDQRTGIRGTVEAGHCGCGSSDPRVVLAR